MYLTILPEQYHPVVRRFLQQSPIFIMANRAYQHLKPPSLFLDITPLTLTALPPSLIATRLDISVQVARRRDYAIRQLLVEHEPALYQCGIEQT